MAASPTYTFNRGEPIVLGRRVMSGDPAGYQVFADIKPTKGTALPPESVAAIASFAVEFVAADGTVAAHWLLSLPQGLPAGSYVTDCRFEKGGQVVEVTKPAFILVTESVTG